MKAVVLIVLALWIAGGIGRLLIGRLSVWGERASLERFAFSAALGLGIAAYGVLALGLCGLLSFWPITLWWLVLAAVGSIGMRDNLLDILHWWRNRRAEVKENHFQRGITLFAWSAMAVCGLVALLACFHAPTGIEWDAISYHLADPKIFLQMGRIVSLPTEHHSNFPFTLEMLFTVGLLYGGFPLANLFHFLTAALTVVAIAGFCARRFSPVVGAIAGLLFCTTPLVLWESSVAYIDVGLGLYMTLAAFAAVSGVSGVGCRVSEDPTQDAGESPTLNTEIQNPTPDTRHPTPDANDWIVLAGVMAGFGLGIKYLALLPFGLVAVYLLWRRVPVKAVVTYVGIALLIGSPWYVKNVVLTRNPVYPYLFSLFPQSRYWSADRAKPYQAEQGSFGYPNGLGTMGRIGVGNPPEKAQNAGVRDGLINLIQTPWRLVSDADRYANPANFNFMTLYGGLLPAFCFALVFLRCVPRSVGDLFLLGIIQVGAWFFVAQVGRYLLSIVPLLAVCAGYATWRLCDACSEAKSRQWALGMRAVVVALLGGQFALLLWGLFLFPLSGLDMPELLTEISQPEGREENLRRRLDMYRAAEWINQNTPQEARILLLEETRGFYLDRLYLWGNGEHSSYIPYDTLRDGQELSAWLRKEGIRYALINLNWSPQRSLDNELANSVAGSEEFALHRWYVEAEQAAKYRQLVQDALKQGLWRTVFARNGVVVLEIGE